MKPKADILIECSWEVCNKVGGIYTVISSKAPNICDNYLSTKQKENYILIGPYFEDKIRGQFQESDMPENYKNIQAELKDEGIMIHYGTWLIKGEPVAILIDFQNYKNKTNDIKKTLWDWYKIDSLFASDDFNEPTVFSFSVGKLIEKICENNNGKKIVAQFHEWLTGAGLLYLNHNKVRVGTVFTTHATILGRTISSNNEELYASLEQINPIEKAKSFNIQAKHQTEMVSALCADTFTTVSEITSFEAEKLLGRKPDIILPNGLNFSRFPTFEETSIKHKLNRDKIREFCEYYFFPYYQFDLEKTLFYFLAGRYEFHDKGIDIYIKSLSELNNALKLENSDETIVAFIFVPANIAQVKHDLIENKTYFMDLKEAVSDEIQDIEKKIIISLISKKKLSEENLFESESNDENKKRVLRLLRKGTPGVSTHELVDQNDIILNTLKSYGLNNSEADRVKVIFYPIYLTGADGLLDLSYYEAMMGAHFGVFPSYYEPWGYTPLEAGALGVSSVTTDLAGFGKYIMKYTNQEHPGMFVIERQNKTEKEVIDSLTKVMYSFSKLSKPDRVKNKMSARKTASLADWSFLIENYIKAHNMAIDKKWN